MRKPKINLNDLATNFIGSVLLMAMFFEKKYQSKKAKEALYWAFQKMAKDPKKHFKTVEDTWNIWRILEAFNINRTYDWEVCIVTSKFNCLLCPYLVTDAGVKPLTPRVDGLPVYTVSHYDDLKIIKWE